MIVAFINCATSVFGGFVIFSLLGYMSDKLNVPVDKVAADGECFLIPRTSSPHNYIVNSNTVHQLEREAT